MASRNVSNNLSSGWQICIVAQGAILKESGLNDYTVFVFIGNRVMPGTF